jgi:hypothetical protein
VGEPVGTALIGQAGGQEIGDLQARRQLAPQQHAAVRGEPAAIEPLAQVPEVRKL